MKYRRLVAFLLALVTGLLAMACGSEANDMSVTATPTALPVATGTQASTPTTPLPRSELALRGEAVERTADSATQLVTWADGTEYQETLPTLILRTLGQADAPHGRRVVAERLEDNLWLVTIFIRIQDRSTEPPTPIDLLAQFHYDEGSGAFEAVNGRASFALSGVDPCAAAEPPADICPLDKESIP